MRQGGERRSDLPFRSYAPNGNTVIGRDGAKGTIIAVDPIRATVTIQWPGDETPVVYPSTEELAFKRALPWQ